MVHLQKNGNYKKPKFMLGRLSRLILFVRLGRLAANGIVLNAVAD